MSSTHRRSGAYLSITAWPGARLHARAWAGARMCPSRRGSARARVCVRGRLRLRLRYRMPRVTDGLKSQYHPTPMNAHGVRQERPFIRSKEQRACPSTSVNVVTITHAAARCVALAEGATRTRRDGTSSSKRVRRSPTSRSGRLPSACSALSQRRRVWCAANSAAAQQT